MAPEVTTTPPTLFILPRQVECCAATAALSTTKLIINYRGPQTKRGLATTKYYILMYRGSNNQYRSTHVSSSVAYRYAAFKNCVSKICRIAHLSYRANFKTSGHQLALRNNPVSVPELRCPLVYHPVFHVRLRCTSLAGTLMVIQ